MNPNGGNQTKSHSHKNTNSNHIMPFMILFPYNLTEICGIITVLKEFTVIFRKYLTISQDPSREVIGQWIKSVLETKFMTKLLMSSQGNNKGFCKSPSSSVIDHYG